MALTDSDFSGPPDGNGALWLAMSPGPDFQPGEDFHDVPIGYSLPSNPALTPPGGWPTPTPEPGAVHIPVGFVMAPNQNFTPTGGWPQPKTAVPAPTPQQPALDWNTVNAGIDAGTIKHDMPNQRLLDAKTGAVIPWPTSAPQGDPEFNTLPPAEGFVQKQQFVASAKAALDAAKAQTPEDIIARENTNISNMAGLPGLEPGAMGTIARAQAAGLREEEIAKAKAAFEAAQKAPVPTQTTLEALNTSFGGGLVRSALDIPKFGAQIASDVGYGGALRGIKDIEENIPQTNVVKQSDPVQKVASTLGEVVPYVVGDEAGIPFKYAVMMAGAGEQKEAAQKAGASLLQQYLAAGLGMGLGGATVAGAEKLALMKVFDRAGGPGTSDMLANILAKGAQGGAELGTMFGGLQFANNAIALAIYDKDRDLLDGVKDSVLTGSIVGAMFGIPPAVMESARARGSFAESLEKGDYHDWFDKHPEFHTTKEAATEVGAPQLPPQPRQLTAPARALPAPEGGAPAQTEPPEPRAAAAPEPQQLGAQTAPETEKTGTRAAPAVVAEPADIEAARRQVAAAPTPQIEAGNYRKGHVVFDGLPISIENPKGSVRSGTDPDGTAWQSILPADYGYVKGSLGKDGDHVDVFLGDKGPNGKAFVIDQNDPKTGKFDEHKIVMGVDSIGEAARIYHQAFPDGSAPQRFGGVTELPTDQLKQWLASGNTQKPMGAPSSAIQLPDGFKPIEPQLEPQRPATAVPKPKEGPALETPSKSPPELIADHLYSKGELSHNDAAALAGIDAKDRTRHKELEESIEHGSVLAARRIVSDGKSPQETFQRLVKLYADQPKLGARTSTSVRDQAYSTPAPLAYVASRLADVTPKTSVLEPSAGNGMLLMTANPKKAEVNEINRGRVKALTQQGFAPSARDATENGAFRPKSVDRVIANPPFGAVRDESGNSKSFDMGKVQEGYKTHEIDHAIAFKALDAMKDDGRATLILGGVNKLASDRAEAYGRSKAKREFFHTLYNNYNVVDHFTVPGELYEKQGAAWPVDVITIAGRGKSALPVPMREAPPVLKDWQEIGGKLGSQPHGDVPATAGRPSGVPAEANHARESPVRNEGNHPDHGQRGPAAGATEPERPEGIRGNRVRQESEPAQPRAATQRGESELPDEHRNSGRNGARARPVEQDEETENQVAYQPLDKDSRSFGILQPRNIARPTHEALQRFEDQHGAPGPYIAERLNFPREHVAKVFSAEQADALALAISNIEKGSALVIGDQTGIGKGRIAAGILRYAQAQGKIPVFVTEKPNLYGDMHRDLRAIGIKDPNILITNNNLMGKGIPLDEAETRFIRQDRDIEAKLTATAETGKLPGHDFLFTTYSQMDPIVKGETVRRQVISKIAPDAIFVFDESHNVGEQKAATQSDIPYRGTFFRDIVDRAGGVAYSSATYAKRPGNMDFYRRTDMRHAVSNPADMGEAFSRGGLPLQEIVASMLSDAGQYVRRERSMSGIEYRTHVAPLDRDLFNDFARGLKSVADFSNALQPALKAMSKTMRADAKDIAQGQSTGTVGIESTKFSSLMHNVISQMLLSAKHEEAANLAIDAIKGGKRPVTALTNTMDSFIREYMEMSGAHPGDAAHVSFNDVLNRYLEKSRTATVNHGFGKPSEKLYLTDQQLGPVGLHFYNEAKRILEDVNFKGLPVSPIDAIHNLIRQAGYRSGEITGRGTGIDYSGETPVYYNREQKEISPGGRMRTINGFNSGEIQHVLINAAGSTGLSLHDSADFPLSGRGQRVMTIAQPNPDINVHMQTLGRVNRTGQLTKPIYNQLGAGAPAESRITAVLAKKMASLNANTTASAGSSKVSEDVPDFMNKYGDHVARQILNDSPEIAQAIGWEPPSEGADDGAVARKLTGHISLLDLDHQEHVMDRLLTGYKELMHTLDETGQNTLNTRELNLDAKYLGGQDIAKATGDSPFRAAAHLGTYDVKSEAKPMTSAQVRDMMADGLKIPENERPANQHDAMRIVQKKGAVDATQKFQIANEKFKEFAANVMSVPREAEAAEKIGKQLYGSRDFIRDALQQLRVGYPVRIRHPDESGGVGYVVGIKNAGKTGNPFSASDWKMTLALPGDKPFSLPLSQVLLEPNAEDKNSIVVQPARDRSTEAVAQDFDSFKGELRERRVIATGNILSAYNVLNNAGRIVRFTDDEGVVHNGIMLPKEVKSHEALLKGVGLKADNPADVVARAPIAAEGEDISIRKRGDRYGVAVPAAKATGGKYYLNKMVLDAAGRDFIKSGNTMFVGDLSREQAEKVIGALMGLGVTFKVPREAPEEGIQRATANSPEEKNRLRAKYDLQEAKQALKPDADESAYIYYLRTIGEKIPTEEEQIKARLKDRNPEWDEDHIQRVYELSLQVKNGIGPQNATRPPQRVSNAFPSHDIPQQIKFTDSLAGELPRAMSPGQLHQANQIIQQVARETGGRAETHIVGRILDENAAGGYAKDIENPETHGFYQHRDAYSGDVVRRIVLSLNFGGDLEFLAAHETFHAMNAFLTPQEHAVLAREQESNRLLAARALDLSPESRTVRDLPHEEVNAFAYEQWRRMLKSGESMRGMHIGVRRIFARINEMMSKIKSRLENIMGLGRGHFMTSEDVFRKIMEGTTALRSSELDRTKIAKIYKREVEKRMDEIAGSNVYSKQLSGGARRADLQ